MKPRRVVSRDGGGRNGLERSARAEPVGHRREITGSGTPHAEVKRDGWGGLDLREFQWRRSARRSADR